MVTGGIHSAPTAGMETLLGTEPIEETIRTAALTTGVRLIKSGHRSDMDN